MERVVVSITRKLEIVFVGTAVEMSGDVFATVSVFIPQQSVVLMVIAVASAIFAVGMWMSIWPGPGDNSTGFYLAVGLPALALSVAALVSLVGLWRR